MGSFTSVEAIWRHATSVTPNEREVMACTKMFTPPNHDDVMKTDIPREQGQHHRVHIHPSHSRLRINYC